MGQIDRREFLEELIASQINGKVALQDDVYTKYANKHLPGLYKTTSYLSPYTGTWSDVQVRHLLRRTMFGVKDADIQSLSGLSMSAAVDYLLNNIPAAPTPPLNNYTSATYTDPTGVALGATWVGAAYGDGTVNSKRNSSYKSWWFGVMLNQNLSILEKMVFFWHNHFSTQTSVIGDARMCYNHNVLLRANALGNFKTLVKLITTDPAMLLYLNGYQNTKTHPDENYGRELQELFTVSKYNTPNYTEADVQTASKVLTGWRINNTTLTSYFDPTQHDTTDKTFSSFYSNTTISGLTGASGANETNTMIDMIFANGAAAHYICQKLYIFFIYYDIGADIEANVISQLASIMIANNYEIKPVLQALLKSDHFFDPNNMGCYIKTPLDFLVGTYRTFNINLPGSFDVVKTYNVWNYLRGYGANLGLDLGDPPNVAGWSPFYESPDFYEIWINSSTLPLRMEFTDMMAAGGFTAGTGTAINIDYLLFTKNFNNAGDPDLLVDYYATTLLGIDISIDEHNSLKSILLSGQTTNAYWTSAWDAYIANPNTANTNIVKTRLSSFLTTLLRLPEHQLC